MPYFVQTAILPTVVETPAGTASPQLQQFAQQLTTDLNNAEQGGLVLNQVVPVGSVAALLVFKK